MPLYILVWILQRWGIHFWNLRFCTAFHDWVTQVVDFFFFVGGGGWVLVLFITCYFIAWFLATFGVWSFVFAIYRFNGCCQGWLLVCFFYFLLARNVWKT